MRVSWTPEREGMIIRSRKAKKSHVWSLQGLSRASSGPVFMDQMW